jgi:hypothetical protein
MNSRALHKIPEATPTLRLGLAKALWNWEPHKTQKTWLLNNSPIKVAACGRRWGKSESCAVDLLTFAIAVPNSTQIVVAPTYDQANILFNTCQRMTQQVEALSKLTSTRRSPYNELVLQDARIMFRTSGTDGRTLRGHSADRIIVDEAAFVLAGVIDEVIGPMLADRQGQLIMVSTPWGRNHFYRAFSLGTDPGEPDHAGFQFPTRDNPYVSASYVQRQRRDLPERAFRVEYEADFIDDVSAVFPHDSIQSAIAEPVPYRGPIAVGVDWARYSDYTVALAVSCQPPFQVIDFVRFQQLPWERQIAQVAEFIAKHQPKVVLTDQTAVGDPLIEQLRTKLWDDGVQTDVRGLVFTSASKRELIDTLAIAFSKGEIRIPPDPDLIRELEYYEYEMTPAGAIKMNARAGYHDDLVIALALAVFSAEHSVSTLAVGVGLSKARPMWD